jgi:hypothetical protein
MDCKEVVLEDVGCIYIAQNMVSGSEYELSNEPLGFFKRGEFLNS